MKKMISLFLFFCTVCSNTTLAAQQTVVDTIVYLIGKNNTPNGLDTSKIIPIYAYINRVEFTDADIVRIEAAANTFKKGENEDLCYYFKLFILGNLSERRFDKAIEYGKALYADLTKSKTPNAAILKSMTYRQLRVPFRNAIRYKDGFQFYNEKLNEFKLSKDSLGLTDTYYVLASFFKTLGLIDQAIYNMRKSLKYADMDNARERNCLNFTRGNGKTLALNNMAVLSGYYLLNEDYENSLKYSNTIIQELKTMTFPSLVRRTHASAMLAHANIAYAKIMINKLDSIEYLLDLATSEAKVPGFYDHVARHHQTRAMYKMKLGKLDEAEQHLRDCWQVANKYHVLANGQGGEITPDYYLAQIRIEQKRYAEALVLLKKDLEWAKIIRYIVLRDHKLLANVYEKIGDFKAAQTSFKAYVAIQDTLLMDDKKYRTSTFDLEQQMDDREKSITQLQNDNKINTLTRNFSIGIAGLLLILAAGVYNRFKTKQRDNKVLEKTLSTLQSTQAQLIQSEKLASLGELTAGIAHEIQNPLNFVNNFAEVSAEMLDEMHEELEKGDTNEAIAIATDLKINLEKINHHGQRASSIVKGMLEHSRASTGVKEPTDLNALADEYLRLAYHGLRAKDNSFNATMETHFDPDLPLVSVIPQDIGRVLLNLINNAFYAVNERQKQMAKVESRTPLSESFRLSESYTPTITLRTKRLDNAVEISIKDNGNGIPESIKDKIFQPFFTTKPTGQGTGLGLSLAYDIVTKGHGGTLEVFSTAGGGSAFIIQLSIA